MEIDKNISESIKEFSKCIESSPSDYKAFYNRGVLYNHVGEFEKAILDYDESLKINNQNDYAYFNRGLSKLNLDKIDESLNDFKRAITINKNLFQAYFKISDIEIRKGDIPKANKYYEIGKSIKEAQNPNLNDSINNLFR